MSKSKTKKNDGEPLNGETEAEVTAETEATENTAEETEVLDIEALKEKAAKADEYLDKYQRAIAEYDNFRKRTVKEKEQLVTDAKAFTVSGLIPILDNLERAQTVAENESDENPLKQGVEMIIRSVIEEFEKLGVKEIKALGEQFDPNYHNAVMHIEDDKVDDNTVVEVFQKGYILGEKIIRPSMVKVAN